MIFATKDESRVSFLYAGPSIGQVPTHIEEFRDWHQRLAATKSLLGPASWSVQTFLQMRLLGLDCTLVDKLPESGLVLSHRDDLPTKFAIKNDRFVVCMLADRRQPHPYAQFHITQNPIQKLNLFQRYAYMPHWPQPGLIARNASRGTKVSTIAFYGERINIAPELSDETFTNWCRNHGMSFQFVPREKWHDYSECDIVIAIRSFDNRFVTSDKPATKLFNSWLAGVPAILGPESSYQNEGCVGIDYLEANSVEDVKAALLRLKNNPEMYAAIASAARTSGSRRNHETIALLWQQIISSRLTLLFQRHLNLTKPELLIYSNLASLKERLVWRGYLLN